MYFIPILSAGFIYYHLAYILINGRRHEQPTLDTMGHYLSLSAYELEARKLTILKIGVQSEMAQ